MYTLINLFEARKKKTRAKLGAQYKRVRGILSKRYIKKTAVQNKSYKHRQGSLFTTPMKFKMHEVYILRGQDPHRFINNKLIMKLLGKYYEAQGKVMPVEWMLSDFRIMDMEEVGLGDVDGNDIYDITVESSYEISQALKDLKIQLVT